MPKTEGPGSVHRLRHAKDVWSRVRSPATSCQRRKVPGPFTGYVMPKAVDPGSIHRLCHVKDDRVIDNSDQNDNDNRNVYFDFVFFYVKLDFVNK
ncbi:hypothetical protein MAR_004582 [Mya arenaria]|uniref:Uncharacterized protein n=1 Tax=Mya arenaria TaxID=6604 RepID=A0ABY7EYS0_MYAAR|nr:hypothetical protein MAR_004582 [Mya arenaria]